MPSNAPDDDYQDIYGQYADMYASPSLMSSSAKPLHHIDLHRAASDAPSSASWTKGLGTWRSRGGEHRPGAPSVSKRTLPLTSPVSHRFGRLPSTWATRLFLLTTLCEAVADVSVEAVLLSRFREQQGSFAPTDGSGTAPLPVFVMVFALAHVYQCFLAFDSVVNRNTILVLGLNVFNLAFLVYAIIQISEIRDVLGDGTIPGTSQRVPVQVLTGAIPAIIGCASMIFCALAWFLWKEFGWEVYKTIGADRGLKRAHLQYQIFLCLLKFDFFTFIAFCLQLVLVVLKNDTAERVVTILATPCSLLLLIFAWWSCRREKKWGMAVFMTGLVGGAGYFTYKLYRIWSERTGLYREVYKSLTVFSVLALALLFATAMVSIRCLMNFDMGLKSAMTRSAEERRLQRSETGVHGGGILGRNASGHGTGMSISAPFSSDGKGMLPLRSSSTLNLERHNPRLSLD